MIWKLLRCATTGHKWRLMGWDAVGTGPTKEVWRCLNCGKPRREKMTIIEAVRSGKRFRLTGTDHWFNGRASGPVSLTFLEIAGEWEIEPEPKPKLRAWIGTNHSWGVSNIVFFSYDPTEPETRGLTRAPWLDER
jgi:hypothetical protein